MSDEQPSSLIHSEDEIKNSSNVVVRRERPSRACTVRSAARIYQAAVAEAAVVSAVRKQKPRRKPRRKVEEEEEEEEEEPPPSPPNPYSNIITPLVGEPLSPSQLPRWNIRSMWELASVLNFLNVFRPLLNIKVEFSVEELETALLSPNATLGGIHIPLLKAIPPVTRMALGQNTWVTVLCRKLRDWWHWVSEGELPIVASHGAEIDTYSTLDPGVRVVILKALCDIRVEQDDIRSYIDDSIKHGVPLSAFRKERTGGDSHGVSYWYEDDPIIGQRLYREIRKVEVKKGKGKNVISDPSYQWETVSTNLDEFQDVSEKLLSSKNRTEASLGKKLKNDMLPEIEKVHKRKEKQLKKQHRQALLLDGMIVDGFSPGRSLRGRKQVSYTFDDYDRSISEAIKITKTEQPSSERSVRREGLRHDASTNNGWVAPAPSHNASFSPPSPDSLINDESDEGRKSEQLDHSRRRLRPQRYSAREFAEAVSDNEADSDSDYNNNNNDENDDDDDDDIVGEAVYDEEYLKKQKEKKKMSSSSEGDEEYRYDGNNTEDEEEEEEEEEFLSASEDSDDSPRRFKKLSGQTRRETKLRSVNDFKSGPRRSRRAARTRINYKQYEFSDSDPESEKPETSNSSDKHSDPSEKSGFSMGSSDDNDDNTEAENNYGDNDNYNNDYIDNDNDNDDDHNDNDDDHHDNDNEEMKIDQPVIEEDSKIEQEEENGTPMKLDSPVQDEFENGARKRRFLDLNELAPGSGFEDGPMKDDDTDNF